MPDDAATLNQRLLSRFRFTEQDLRLNQQGRIAESQKHLMAGTVIQCMFFFAAAAVLLRTTAVCLGASIAGAALFALLYWKAPHVLVGVKHADGVLHKLAPESVEEGRVQLVDPATSRPTFTFEQTGGESMLAFVEGAKYRVYYIKAPGSGGNLLSAEALQ